MGVQLVRWTAKHLATVAFAAIAQWTLFSLTRVWAQISKTVAGRLYFCPKNTSQ
ncbi:hypothetical protein [Scytonema sp. NUACC21]